MELAKGRAQGLQSQIDELQEEVSLQRTTHGDTSLLSEMEHSLDTMNWSQDQKQVNSQNKIQHTTKNVTNASEKHIQYIAKFMSLI